MWPWALGLSVTLHLAVVFVSTHLPDTAARPPAIDTVVFELAAISEPPDATTTEPSQPQPASTPARTPRVNPPSLPVIDSGPDRLSPPSPSLPESAGATDVIAASPSSVTRPQVVDVAPPRISPADAARTMQPSLPTRQEVWAARGAALSADLGAIASSRPHLQRRSPPTLSRTPDGGYVYEGPAFAATIRPDGSVSFDVRPVQGHLSTTVLSFDLTDAMLSAMGEELYPTEKRWFLEQTQELREQLEATDRMQVFARATRALRDALLAINNNPRLIAHQKRDAIFALWADCADDEVGARGRGLIEDFVREHFAESSARAFTATELQRFNQRNAAVHRFDPYASTKPAR